MFGAIFSILSNGLAVLKKLLPSWEWKGGQASEQARQAKEVQDAQDRMDAVSAPDKRTTIERLRKRKF